jgi:alpha-tubulin suppressor-like RCC1 family protein
MGGRVPPASGASPTKLTAGTLLTWGDNSHGELGNGSASSSPVPTPTPVMLNAAVGAANGISLGGESSFATTSGGQLYSFGGNLHGELGITATSGSAVPDPTPTLVTIPGGSVTEAAAGGDYSLALTAAGQVYAFGSDSNGQLGPNGTVGNAPHPTPLLVPVPQPGSITVNHLRRDGAAARAGTPETPVPVNHVRAVLVAAGGAASFVLASDGHLYGFGDDFAGGLGSNLSGGETDQLTPVSLPGQVGTITAVSTNGGSTLVATSSGQLYGFGDNLDGELGSTAHNKTTQAVAPFLVTLPGEIGTVTHIASGGNFSLVATSGGQLYGFGADDWGQLGLPPPGGPIQMVPLATLVTLPGQEGVVTSLAATSRDGYVVTSSGQLYAFGDNEYGQLGTDSHLGEQSVNATPALVPLPNGTTIESVATGSDAIFASAIVSDLAVASPSLPPGVVGSPYSGTLSASGGVAPYTWSASGLPQGLAIVLDRDDLGDAEHPRRRDRLGHGDGQQGHRSLELVAPRRGDAGHHHDHHAHAHPRGGAGDPGENDAPHRLGTRRHGRSALLQGSGVPGLGPSPRARRRQAAPRQADLGHTRSHRARRRCLPHPGRQVGQGDHGAHRVRTKSARQGRRPPAARDAADRARRQRPRLGARTRVVTS